jgi:hypothetical protein
MMLGELPQKEWGLGEVIRRKEEVSFFSLPSVFQGDERSTRWVCVLRHDEGDVRPLEVQSSALGI